MPKFQRVTVALSLTATDADVLRYAALVARLGVSTEFRFVHVVTEPHAPAGDQDAAALQDRLSELVQAHFGMPADGLKLSCHVREGVRVDSLIAFVVEHESDLIVLGHRKHRSGRRSLARRLAMISPCSVWMVPEGAPVKISRILAPVDFSDHSADSLSQAAAVARVKGLEECLALHVFFDPSTVRYDEHISEVCGNEERAFREFLGPVNTHGISIVPVYEESANVANAILRCARKHEVDLIVMSTRGRSRAASILLGSATSQTLTESEIPVLAVKHYGAHLNLFQVLSGGEIWTRPNPKSN